MWLKNLLIVILITLNSQLSVSNHTEIENVASSNFGMRFRLPFIDMNIQSVSRLKIIKDVAGQQVFLIHGTDLYRLILEKERKVVNLIGKLEGAWKEDDVLDAEIISWHKSFLLVVALDDHLEIFQFSNETLMTDISDSDVPEIDSIQQITLHGRYRKFLLCETSEDSVTLIVLVNFNKMSSRLNTYEWSKTYFDPIVEKTIAPIQDIAIIGSDVKYLVTSKLSRSQTKITITTFTVLPTINQVQVMQLQSKRVHAFTYQAENYLLTCIQGHQKCVTFKMAEGQFIIYKKRPINEVNFSHLTAGDKYLVGLKEDKVTVYLTARLECYGTFRTDTNNITSILTYVSEEGSHFLMLNYIRSDSTLLRIVEIEFEEKSSKILDDDVDDLGDPVKHQKHAFEQSIAKLRKILLIRRFTLNEIQQTIHNEQKNFVLNHPTKIFSGNIGMIKIFGSKLRSPLQILRRLQAISNKKRKSRFAREFVDDFNKTSPSNLKVRSLKVGNLILEHDLIPNFTLSSDLQHLKISTPVTTKILQTKELLTATVMVSQNFNPFPSRSATDSTTTSIQHLKVNRINGVLWEDFYQNVFLRSRDRSISGRLILESSVDIGNLQTPNLNNLPTKNLFDLVNVQNITSDIVISRFFANDLQADLINGLDIKQDVARKGVDNIINSPVVAKDVSVTGELILVDVDQKARHIFGTNSLDLQQTYNEKVVIEGSLTLVNLFVEDQTTTRVIIGEEEISPDLTTNFWMQSVSQEFPQKLSFLDCTISAPALNTMHLNGHPVSDYLFTTTLQSAKPVQLIFLSAQIDGSLIADEVLGTKLRHIDNIAVKSNSPIIVTGEKVFQGRIEIDHADIGFLNQLPVKDLIPYDQKIVTFTGNKTFKSVEVTKEALITQQLESRLLNGVLPVDDPSNSQGHFQTIVLNSLLKANNIEFNFLNGFSAENIFKSIQFKDDDFLLHKDLFVEGSLEFNDLQVNTINQINWNNYVDSLVRINEKTVISGRKTFANDLTILTQLKTPTINNVAIDNLLSNILLRSQHQVISGSYTFGTLKLDNINVPDINGFSTSDFIDTRSPRVTINSDVVFKQLTIGGSVFGNVDIDFALIQKRMNDVLTKPWKNLYVLGDARWKWGQDQQSIDLQYLFENAVRHFDDQIITGNVKIKKPLISNMRTKEAFPKDIDFDHIATDCLYHNSSMEEMILASKTFLKPIQLLEFTALGHLGTKLINGIDILEFNSSLYRLSQPSVISGSIDFQVPPIIGHLTVQGLVNQKPTSQIFVAYNDRLWPPVRIDNLHIDENLQLYDIDHMSLNFLLQNRVRLSGSGQEIFGHLTFENLVLDKKIYLQSINGISLDNVVQKTSATLQEITGTKTIDGELKLIGPAMVIKLNGIDLIDRYKKTVFLDRNYEFNSLSIRNATFKDKLIISNPISKSPLADLLHNETYKKTFNIHKQSLQHIQSNLRLLENAIDAKAMNLKRLMYLDYDFNTLVEWKLRNDSIQEQFIFDNNRYQYCDREQTLVKWSRYHNRISLTKIITNTLSKEDHGIRVTADNNCKEGYRHVNSHITISDPHMNKKFILDKLVHNIEIYSAIDMFVMLHCIDLYAGKNEIRFIKIDSHSKTFRDWQLLTDGVGKVSKLFKLTSHTILVVSTVIENYPSITIYNLNPQTQIFDVVQVIDGDFDIIELNQVTPHSYHLFLSCVHCQRIVIFEHEFSSSTGSNLEDCQMFHIYQILKLRARISRFNIFTLSDGGIYMLVLSDQDIDFYHIYKYQFIQGWKHYTYGYFKNIQNAYPLLKDGISSVDDNLLLLCNRKCTLVKAVYQL